MPQDKDIHSLTEKTSLVDADEFVIADSADTFAFKRVKNENIASLVTQDVGSKLYLANNYTQIFRG